MKTLPYIFISIVAILPADAFAIKQYTCDGRIQYRPCGQEISVSTKRASKSSSRSKSARYQMAPSTPRFARIVEQSFKPAKNSEGVWRGVVEGNGKVHLYLRILRAGAIESTQYMGNVQLQNKSTWFAYKSVLPKGNGWSWMISASAT